MIQFRDYMSTPTSDSAQIILGRCLLELLREKKEKADPSIITTEELGNMALGKGVNNSPRKIVDIFTTYYKGLVFHNKRGSLWQLAEGVNLEDFEETINILEGRAGQSTERL